MFGFIKKIFLYSHDVFWSQCLKCVSVNNRDCKIRPEILDISSNESWFYPYSFLVNKCSGSCNNSNDPYANLCISDIVKYINIKIVNLMPHKIAWNL